MIRCITCYVFHMRKFCRFFYCLAWFDTVAFNRPPCSNNEMFDDAVLVDRFRCQLIMFGIRELIGLSQLLHAHIAYQLDMPKSSQHSFIFPIDCVIWYAWIQSFAMFKQQDVRLCGFRWSIPISIDYVWREYIDRAILTPWYSYCIWNSCIKNHHWWLASFEQRFLMQDCRERLV